MSPSPVSSSPVSSTASPLTAPPSTTPSSTSAPPSRICGRTPTTSASNPGAVALWGESAGGHLAALTAVTHGLPEFSDATVLQGQVQAVIDAYGSSELSAIADDFEEAARVHYQQEATHFSAYLGRPGAPFPEIPDAVRAADPATHATASAPPFLFLHGTEDMLVSPSQTQHVHRALRAAGADSTRYVLKGANHGDVAFLGGPSTGLLWTSAATMGIVTEFLHHRLDATER
ncbi:prolyl oligopeptidase family serine peptidase [Streptomyces galilaeus]